MRDRGMKLERFALWLRYTAIFWIAVPLVVTAILFVILAALGRLGVPNAEGFLGSLGFGAAFLAALAPVVTAHVIVFAASCGVLGVLLGLRPDWKLSVLVLIGFGVGLPILWLIYSPGLGLGA